MELDNLSIEELRSVLEERRTALAALFEVETPSDEQIAEAEALGADVVAVEAAIEAIESADATKSEKWSTLKERFTVTDPEDEETDDDEEAEEEEPEVVDEVLVEPTEEAAAEEETVVAQTSTVAAATTTNGNASTVKRLAAKTTRPKAPEQAKPSVVTITAAADVPDFATGSKLEMSDVADALIARMSAFGVPSGDGRSENLQHYGVAKFKMEFPEDQVIDSAASENQTMETINRVANESRLEGGSLVAAGGWCSPSETFYDLCVTGESLDGIVSIPEVAVSRGGMRFTKGPDFSAIYGTSAFFTQTEAQAIAGDAKSCYEVECPSWTDVRLDAVGICIKAPILTNAAYPEIVNRYLTGSMVAHAHKVNAAVIAKMVTIAGAAEAVVDFSSTAHTTLSALELLANYKRQTYKLGLNETLEVVLPYWVKSCIRDDLSLRTGQEPDAITDQQVQSHFAARHLNVQWVYDWQELDTTNTTEGYTATFTALIYPAGTFVKGTSDVITLNAVYDAASLSTNLYTALFFEQGLLVANRCADADLVTIPVFNSGRTGIANLSVAGTATA